LTQLGPHLTARNPRVRSPRVVAHYPERQILLLEFLEATRLDTMLFGSPIARAGLPPSTAIRLAAEWLATLHSTTRSEEHGNPFEFLIERFQKPSVARSLHSHVGPGLYAEIIERLADVRTRYRDHREPLCTVHGEFAPYHLLVSDDAVYVIDFASSRTGYALQDLAFFSAFYDALPPWRHALGVLKMSSREQRSIFLSSYLAAQAPLDEPTGIAAHFFHILAFSTFASRTSGRHTWKQRALSWGIRSWMKGRFRHVCRERIDALARADGS
jgi:Ser/Thr protein kinase RdoA (MazF antagonist)